MIQIIDKNKYGIMLWGTKLGAQKFLNFNINIPTNDQRPFKDLREVGNRFETNNNYLFGYEHKDGYHTYSVFKSLLDWRDRTGYFAVTLYISDTKIAPTDKIASLLKQLSDLYENEYVDKRVNKIYEIGRAHV